MTSVPMALREALDGLRERYGAQPEPPPRGAFEWLLWENVAYLAHDTRRAEAFKLLRERVGTLPEAVAAAADEELLAVARHGIMPEKIAARLRDIAEVALAEFDGDVDAVLRLPLREAKRALQRFPSIGEPGAEKILLFTRAYPLPALDSNCLRVLLRLGYGEQSGNYAAEYRSAQRAIGGQAPRDCDGLIQMYLLLRCLGHDLCRRSAPDCAPCPLAGGCAYAARGGPGSPPIA